MTADVFISFASKDHKVAMTLCQSLERRGVKCWISARDILAGENFQVAIVQAIRNARILLLVFTANSNNSEEMTKELALASQQKMIVIPLRVEDVTPNDAFAYEFATRQWIDAFADWEFAIDQLVQRISSALEVAGRAEPAPAPLIEPPHPPAPAVLPLGEIIRKAKAGPHPVEAPAAPEPAAANADEAPTKRPLSPVLWVAAAVAAVVGLGIVAPSLLKGRDKPATPVLAVARLQAAEAVPAPVTVAAAPAPAPLVEAALEPEKPAPPPPKRKPRQPQPDAAHTDIPY